MRLTDASAGVIRRQPENRGVFLGTPSLLPLGNGTLLASHDYFGWGKVPMFAACARCLNCVVSRLQMCDSQADPLRAGNGSQDDNHEPRRHTDLADVQTCMT